MGVFDKVKGWLFEDDTDSQGREERDQEYEESESDNVRDYERDYQSAKSREGIDAFVILVKPEKFADVEEICRHVKEGRAVILNTENTVPEDKQRLIDFLSGVVMAKDGMIAKIYQNVYICSPKNIGVVEE